ncbi:MAG: methionine--tRNA ligase [Sphingomonadaceae bacterium]|uniref:methionine--tRNA ligase n=1 Tax=Thermaurantiacus sp. TaxID=2820283 RepID=UPI00298F1711|nr:methionine--tRNA ligase [Thermaurantiacus sp.]MCS6985830.1 methionine--tRNA ligase [Sphingomonadaceae bacterium]MDW8413901.1 methionine--tRNA ligase [Thermaurantiacus sp.]
MTGEPFFVTTAISYPNGRPHIGHAYEAIATDWLARFARLDGRAVFFLTGTDEHGLKIAQAARARGLSPRAFVDEMSSLFRKMAEDLRISFDRFIRTTDPDHRVCAQALWQRMAANGDLYLGRYEGWYSVRDEAFWDEADTTLDADGVRRAPTGTEVTWTVEESWFFRLSRYQERLLDLYDRHPEFVQPAFRLNEMRAFVERGLKDLSVSRTSFDWGIPVPGAPGHVMYVWVDALANYLTPTRFWTGEGGWPWPAQLHVIGKDVMRFHAVYWPAFLMSAGLPLPRRVFGHGFILNRGEKMSKSAGNVVEPSELVQAFGLDAVRHFLLRAIPFGQDGEWSPEAIAARANAELANDLGNLAQRVLSMIVRTCGGRMPSARPATPEDEALAARARALLPACRSAHEAVRPDLALEAIWDMVAATNLYLTRQAPWTVRRTDPARAEAILWRAADALRRVGLLLQASIPDTAARLLDQLAVPAGARGFAGFDTPVPTGTPVPEPRPLFPRLELPA